MFNNLSVRYYQKSKEKIQKKFRERYENLTEEEKTESHNMAANNIIISHKLKNKD